MIYDLIKNRTLFFSLILLCFTSCSVDNESGSVTKETSQQETSNSQQSNLKPSDQNTKNDSDIIQTEKIPTEEAEQNSQLPKTSDQVQSIELKGLKKESIFPFNKTKAKAIVFFFVCTDCPVACRYAPELNRIHDDFHEKGVEFWLVYADNRESEETIVKHLKEYKHKISACTDFDQKLMSLTKATVTPEAAVFNTKGELVYRGRIDNRYHDFGVTRSKATKQELRDALNAILENRKITNAVTKPIGCFIPKK